MKYLIDENLPKSLNIWASNEFIHVTKLHESLPDDDIWKFALERNLIIITKDTDFHERIIFRTPPPRVILFRTGNTSVNFLQKYLTTIWANIEEDILRAKLVIVYRDKIEGVK